MQKIYKGFKLPLKISESRKQKKEKISNKLNKVFEEVEKITENSLDNIPLTSCLEDNLKNLKEIFKDCSDTIFRIFSFGEEKIECFLVYLDEMVKKDTINENILRVLMTDLRLVKSEQNIKETDLISAIKNRMISIGEINDIPTMKDTVNYILRGHCILFIDGNLKALAFNVKGWEIRNISETKVESVIRGPQEGFTEEIKVNISMLRRRIKTPDLKMEQFEVGKISKTTVVMAYIKGIAEETIVEEVRQRINRIDTDIIMESGYIEQFIEDNPYTPFPLMEMTERPDGAAIATAEGRIVIITDTTPFVLIVPSVLPHFMTVSEDNYTKALFASFIRFLRYFALTLALFGPSIYVAVTTFHQEMIPTTLLISIATSRSEVPFPAIVEALIMEFVFEVLREAGERLPKMVGQALSIVGALVIGQTAVQAGLVSPAMVIVVSVTATSSFAIPKFNLGRSIRILRFPIMLLSGIFGIFGLIMGMLALLTHLASLRSFGVPYLSPIAPINLESWKSLIFKYPNSLLNKRPTFLQNNNIKKTSKDSVPKAPDRR